MGKQKYPKTGTGVAVDGEYKQRDHTKTGKLAKRREVRRLEAIGRQVERVQTFEKALEKAKDKDKAQKDLDHARLTLQKIRGGMPERDIIKKYSTTSSIT